jgi:hypothetical protein
VADLLIANQDFSTPDLHVTKVLSRTSVSAAECGFVKAEAHVDFLAMASGGRR